ncbi:D-3-phosphoglycerate dehydrogenase [Psychroflexus salarius]|uniref:D-3-phosphoglycerate dehydrogenase n=1 Tax=Psychroflexus salarius TaxID=1155689 RepID=A0A1M4ULR0_9FLAO|nr:2-hydroxyacid dehydrogenase [Psychroflexus salarius]SHE57656.1 D-3-phosphoglycerate dehydrogenase [Psychroflexus salarius]
MKVLHLDQNHPALAEGLAQLGFENHMDYNSSKTAIEAKIQDYQGLIIRSRFPLDATFLQKATQLKFIGRVGAGLENIDLSVAKKMGITCFNAPEGNRNAVGEHALGLLLSLFNKLHTAHVEVQSGLWQREANRGLEIEGKTIGLIGYGNMGKAFAKVLRGFDCEVLFYDIKENIADENATQVDLQTLQENVDVLSLHTPLTELTEKMVNAEFISRFKKNFWLINTARGKSVVTKDLVEALKSGKILGAGLDVLEFEKSSFEDFFTQKNLPAEFNYLTKAKNVILTPHIAGWTQESNYKLAKTIVDKVAAHFSNEV